MSIPSMDASAFGSNTYMNLRPGRVLNSVVLPEPVCPVTRMRSGLVAMFRDLALRGGVGSNASLGATLATGFFLFSCGVILSHNIVIVKLMEQARPSAKCTLSVDVVLIDFGNGGFLGHRNLACAVVIALDREQEVLGA